MNLQSNTQFGKLCKSKEKEFKTRLEYLNWYESTRNKVDDFLEQPLELWMLVPCNKAGKPLEEPLREHYTDCTPQQNEEDYQYNLKIYKQAKERCLFEHTFGFSLNEGKEKELFELIQNIYPTVEALINCDDIISLTPTTIKQLGFDVVVKNIVVVGSVGLGHTKALRDIVYKDTNIVVIDDISTKLQKTDFPRMKKVDYLELGTLAKKQRKQNNRKKKKRK